MRLLDIDPSAIASNRHVLLALPGSLVTASSCGKDEDGLYEVVIQKEVDKKAIRKLADKGASVSDHLDGCINREIRAVQTCDALIADIQSSAAPGKRSGYIGMTRYHRSRSNAHTSSSDEAVNHLVDQLRQTAGGVKGLGVFAVGIVRDVDEVMPKTALHFAEHLLNIAGHFTDQAAEVATTTSSTGRFMQLCCHPATTRDSSVRPITSPANSASELLLGRTMPIASPGTSVTLHSSQTASRSQGDLRKTCFKAWQGSTSGSSSMASPTSSTSPAKRTASFAPPRPTS